VALGVFQGCTKVSYTTVIDCVGPNWTSDNKIEFFKVERVWKHTETFYSERADIVSEKSWLCEINKDGTGFEEKGFLFDDPCQGISNSSSAGDWVVLSDGKYKTIWIVKRDGTGLEKVGSGLYPDFSPDASKIVYQKPNQGIWIMNRDGSNDHCIVSDTRASDPAWNPDDTLVAYVIANSETLHICDTGGNILNTYIPLEGGWYESPDWAPKDTNAVIVAVNGRGWSEIIYVGEDIIKKDIIGWYAKWSPQGGQYISYDGSWFVINKNGTNKWYLKDKIGGK